MPKQFEGEMCVLCRARPSSPTGEHVWPRWLLLEMFRPVDGPYSWWISGTQVVRRDGLPREHASVGGVKLPVCVECNSILDRRFEKSAKRPVRLLMAQDGDVVFAGTDGMVVVTDSPEVQAARASVPPTLIRRTPSRAASATVMNGALISRLTGLGDTAATIAVTCST